MIAKGLDLPLVTLVGVVLERGQEKLTRVQVLQIVRQAG